MTKTSALIAVNAVIVLAVSVALFVALKDHGGLKAYVQAESAQRVHTIGERCESQLHQAMEHGPQEAWFIGAHSKCLGSLAKVEARAGVRYSP